MSLFYMNFISDSHTIPVSAGRMLSPLRGSHQDCRGTGGDGGDVDRTGPIGPAAGVPHIHLPADGAVGWGPGADECNVRTPHAAATE